MLSKASPPPATAIQCCENCRHWLETARLRGPRRLGNCKAPVSVPVAAIVTLAPTWPEQGRDCVFFQARYPR